MLSNKTDRSTFEMDFKALVLLLWHTVHHIDVKRHWPMEEVGYGLLVLLSEIVSF